MRKPSFYILAGLFFAVLLIGGCRVRSAGEDIEPTAPGQIVSNVNVDFTSTDDASNALNAQTTPTATETPSITPTPTLFVFTETPTPSATFTFAFGPSLTPTSPFDGSGGATEEALPLGEPSATPTATTQQIAAFPSATPTSQIPTNTPTATNTATFAPPTATATPSPTLSPSPSATPTQQAGIAVALGGSPTATFTAFPTLTPTAQGIAQAFTPTANPQQATATALVEQFRRDATRTIEAQLGTTTFTPDQLTTPQQFGGTPTVPQTGLFPDCEYLIQPGDRLGTIARTYNVTVDALAARNSITNPNFIKAGDRIWIPGCGRNPTPTPTGTLTPPLQDGQGGFSGQENLTGTFEYTVQAGDNIYRLSVTYGVTMREILNANPRISDINLIIAGEKLIIPPRSQPVTTPTPALSS